MSRETPQPGPEPQQKSLRNPAVTNFAQRGAGLASVLRGTAVSALFAALCSGCLVTDQIDFQEESDFPPSFQNEPTAPALGTVIRINRAAPTTPTMPVSIKVRIRDENVQQALTLRVRIRFKNDGGNPPYNTIPVPISGTAVRELPVPLQTDQLRPGQCHLLELAVSGSFITSTPPIFLARETKDPDDLAVASWTIWEGDVMTPEEQAKIADTCPVVTDLTASGALGPDDESMAPEGAL